MTTLIISAIAFSLGAIIGVRTSRGLRLAPAQYGGIVLIVIGIGLVSVPAR